MLHFSGRSKGPSYRHSESIHALQDLQKMELPADDDTVFEEVQSFDQAWIWVLLGVQAIAIMLPVVLTGQPWWVLLLTAAVMAMTLSLMASLKLKTRIDDEGIHYRMVPFHWREQTIPWSDMDSVYVRKYSPLKEYGGWGIKYGRNGKAINVRGNMGLQIMKKNGKKILIGTDRPDEMTRLLELKPLSV